MSPVRLPTLRECLAGLKGAGFAFARQKGTHAVYKNDDGRMAVVPMKRFSHAKAYQLQQLINGKSVRFLNAEG